MKKHRSPERPVSKIDGIHETVRLADRYEQLKLKYNKVREGL